MFTPKLLNDLPIPITHRPFVVCICVLTAPSLSFCFQWWSHRDDSIFLFSSPPNSVQFHLFDRQGRSLQLNRFGKAFLEHIETIFSELEEGQRKVRDMARLEQGEVSLGAASIYWLPDMLHSFQVLHPSIRFHLFQCSLAEMPHRLETGACDFCRWESLRTEEVLLVVPPMHRLAGQEMVPLSEVAHEAVVIEKVGSGLRDLVDTFCQQAGFILHPSYEIDEPAALFAFVKAQLGVGFTTALMEKRTREHTLTPLHLTNPTANDLLVSHGIRSIISLRQPKPSPNLSESTVLLWSKTSPSVLFPLLLSEASYLRTSDIYYNEKLGVLSIYPLCLAGRKSGRITLTNP